MADAAEWRHPWRDGPLRRPVDVVEGWLLLVLGTALWAGALLVGALAGWIAYGQGVEQADQQRASRQPVQAEVVRDVSGGPGHWADGDGRVQKMRAEVRWTGTDGRPATGVTLVPADAGRGDRLEVWLDAYGRPTQPPMSPSDVWLGAVMAGTTVGLLGAGAAAGARVVVRRVAERRRMAQWEDEWERVEPEWRRRGAWGP
ncbi:hypothetical protein GCM10023237_62340 [Streptomyces coeruleoprunus]